MPSQGGGAAPTVDQLRQEVQSLRQDVDTIRSTMQEMHREVGSAVLLLSRFVGLQWNADEALRLAEEKTASASDAMSRLSDNVGTLEQRLTAAEEPIAERTKGAPVGGGGSTPTRPAPARTGSAAHEAQLAGCGGDVASSPSVAPNRSPEAALGTAPVAREAEAGIKERKGDREARPEQNLRQASTADSSRKEQPSASENGGDEDGGDGVASSPVSGRSAAADSAGVGNDDCGNSEGSSASSAAGPERRCNGRPLRDIDGGSERGPHGRRGSGGGQINGDVRPKGGRSRQSEGRLVDRPLSDAAQGGVLSSASPTTENNDDDQVLWQPSSGRLSSLRRSRASVVADGGGGRSDAVGTKLNPAPDEPAAEAVAAAKVLAEEGKKHAVRDELKGARKYSAAAEKSEVGAAAPVVVAASEEGSLVHDENTAEAEGGHNHNQGKATDAEDKRGGATPTGIEASSAAAAAAAAAAAKTPHRNRTSVPETPRADSLAPSPSDRKESLATDQNGGEGTHGFGRRQDEDRGTTTHTTTQDVVARDTERTSPAVLARSRGSPASENVLVASPGGSGQDGPAAVTGADEKKRDGGTVGGIRERRDSERGRSNSAVREPGGSLAVDRPGTALLDNEARGSLSSKGPFRRADRTLDAPKATSSSIRLDPLEPRPVGGGSAENAADVSEPIARLAKTRASTEVESGEEAERPTSSGRLPARGQKAGVTAAPSRNAETGSAPVVSEATGKRGDIEGGSAGGRSFSDDSSHTSGGSSWTSRTGDTRSSFSEESTAASTRASSPSEKGRAADGAAGKRSSSSSSSGGGRRRRSRSRSKQKQVVVDGGADDGTAGGRRGTQSAQTGDHQPVDGAASDKRRASGHHVDADAADAVADVAAARAPRRGSSSTSFRPSGPRVGDESSESEKDKDR